ncbi:hypothetical protein EW146_g10359 [Bondarzewia mesenterica]|uniref:ATP-dependent DNA helicase n=1 Tax=Bondarzewia mesenterica TaxID=1095465 RepID=A0A4S4KZN7_9AGAM|nr:hypothetical protein EW146_g10359 [Bondarzewia mesenterica]
MAVARYYRKIDIFLTMTTNPNWEEIRRALLPGQKPADRPDLIARAFHLKRDALLHSILRNGIFGATVAHIYTIEFQKRGLPHMHLLIFFEDKYKLRSPADVDSVISAQWPDPDTHPLLFETVKNCMVHGPCGAANMPFKKRQQWMRMATPSTVGLTMDTAIIAMFDCHINVECAVNFASVKYVHKYIFKGHDRTTLEISDNDEIKQFIDARYISAAEAAWRIFHFNLHSEVPNVVRLQIHLPGHHMVNFNPADTIEQIMNVHALGAAAREKTYQEFPQSFVWNKKTKKWKIRERGFALGRMYFVPPTAGERFYLRTLLTVVRGPQSFDDLLTFNGVLHATFREACLARGLLADDGEWEQCLREASFMQTGTQLRHLFATILLHCAPTKPDVLWMSFRAQICDDLSHRLRARGLEDPTDDQIYDFGLFLLAKILDKSGKSLDRFPPMPLHEFDWDVSAENELIAQQLNYNLDAEATSAARRLSQLNTEQRLAYDRIISSVYNQQGRVFFLNGPAGTGKTFVYHAVCNRIRSEGWIVLCVASSGIAALLLPGGRTSHSTFMIPIEGLNETSICPIPKESKLADLIRQARLIVWDEVPMQHRFGPEAVNRTCQDLRDDVGPFGGITVVFGGDFQQILPVIPHGSREQTVSASLQSSPLWDQLDVLHLHRNMRLDTDPDAAEFASWLLDVGHGRALEDDLNIRLPDHMSTLNLKSLIDAIYPGIDSLQPPPPEYFLNRMILAARNDQVYGINQEVLQQLSGEEKVFLSADSIVEEEGADGPEANPYPIEFLHAINPASLPPSRLHVKLGCPLILLRNLDPACGMCNGSRMVLLRMSERVLEARLIGGDHDGNIVFIPRISLIPSSFSINYAFVLKRHQFPIRLAFAMTINKAQGQSVKYVGLDLRTAVFTHGQLYVALSRATSGRRIKVLLPDSVSESITPNIVYPEVLLD